MLVKVIQLTELEYYFACTCKGIYLSFIMSPDKMILAVLEL